MSLSIHFHGLHLDAQYGQRIVTLDYCALYEYSYLFPYLHDIRRRNYAVERGLVVGFCGQPHYCCRPYYPTEPGFDLPRHTWSLVNRFPGRFHVVLTCTNGVSPNHLLVIVASDNHIVDTCPLTKFDGGLNVLHEADDDERTNKRTFTAIIRLESTATAAFAK